MLSLPKITASRLVGCDGQYPACRNGRAFAIQQASDISMGVMFGVFCPECGRTRRGTISSSFIQADQRGALERAARLVRLPPFPPFGAGPAVQG